VPKPLVAVITIVIIILVGLGAWWFLTAQPAKNSTTASSQTTSENQTSAPSTDGITIVFTNNGFEQQNYAVAAGQTVTVKNESSIELEFSSDEHPTHTDNPELNMEILQPGKQTTFTPTEAGTWGIHDHEHPEFTTTLTVTD
jgi:hypothetical protein